jgi:hypothetical protein
MDTKRKILLIITWDILLDKILQPNLMFNQHQILIHNINMFQKQIHYFILHPLIQILQNTLQMGQALIIKRRQNILNQKLNLALTILLLVNLISTNMIITLHPKM